MKKTSVPCRFTAPFGILLLAALWFPGLVFSQPNVVGQWAAVQSWPVVGIDMIILPNGKMLVWPRDGGNQARIWDPGNNSFTPVPLSSMNLFCAGHAFLGDGRLFVPGGHIRDGTGEKLAHIFDYRNNTWTRVADMNAGRWYPTATTLANGDVLVSSGSTMRYNANQVFQVWQDATSAWRTLTAANLSLPLYPFMHLAPNGKVFNSGPNTTTRYLDTAGAGAWTILGNRATFRDYGSSVQYLPGKIILIGGGDPPVNTAEVIDLNAGSPAWRPVGSMAFGRRMLNATLLPDGKVLVTGGTSGAGFNDACNAVFAAEIWDPVTEQFTTLPPAAERRLYHSTGVLLPDGRVLTGGGGQPSGENCADADHPNIQIYSPAYLFQGTRPTISSVPSLVNHGQSFAVTSPNTIAEVNLVRLPSVTHAFDMNQLFVPLSFTQSGGTLNVTAPISQNICPPGHYMLFVLNSAGVPSTGAIVQVLPGGGVTPPPAPTGLVATGGAGEVQLSWNAVPMAATYNLKRSTTSGGPYSTIAPGLTGTSYSDMNVTGGTTYYYVVSGVNSGGEGPNSTQASATPTPPTTGNGTGLKGDYYDNEDFTAFELTRVDPTIDFNYGNSAPAPGMGNSSFSIRWTGFVEAEFSQTYTFYTLTDDGVRLWVNGQLLIDRWVNQGPTEYNGSITLQAGTKYAIQMDYYDHTGGAVARLFWSSPSTPREIIPQSQLYPE